MLASRQGSLSGEVLLAYTFLLTDSSSLAIPYSHFEVTHTHFMCRLASFQSPQVSTPDN